MHPPRPVRVGLSSLLLPFSLPLFGIAAVSPALAQTLLDYHGTGSGLSEPGIYGSTSANNFGRGTFGAQTFRGTDSFHFSFPTSFGPGGFTLSATDNQYPASSLGQISGDITGGVFRDDIYTADLASTSADGIFGGYKGTGTFTVSGLPAPGFGAFGFQYSSAYHLSAVNSCPAADVPEPSVLALLGIGAVPLGLIGASRRRRHSA